MRDDKQLNCRQCGREFVLTSAEQEFYQLKGFNLPTHCKECRASKAGQIQHLACSKCGTDIDRGVAVYCAACLEGADLAIEEKVKQIKMAASAARTKLEASESQKAELAELLRQKEQLVDELEQRLSSLGADLDQVNKFYAAAGWLQPVLDGIEGKLKDLERTQRDINQRMLQTIRIMQERFENIGLLEIIKRNLRQSLKEGA